MSQKQQNSRNKRTGKIMVVDDDPITLKNLRRIFEKDGHSVSTFNNPIRALKKLEEAPCDLIITDLKMPYLDGISLLNKAKRLPASVEVIVVTGYADLDGAIKATRQGAFYYLAKPYTPEKVRALVEQALEQKFLKEESVRRVEKQKASIPFPLIIGESPRIVSVQETIRQIAPSGSNVRNEWEKRWET